MQEGTTYLSKQELEDFRQQLLDKREQLAEEKAELARDLDQETQPEGQMETSSAPTHPSDAAADERQEKMALRLTENEREMIQGIDEALERIDQGTYGVCLGTGEKIDRNRLQAKPWAKFSLKYAQSQESRDAR